MILLPFPPTIKSIEYTNRKLLLAILVLWGLTSPSAFLRICLFIAPNNNSVLFTWTYFILQSVPFQQEDIDCKWVCLHEHQSQSPWYPALKIFAKWNRTEKTFGHDPDIWCTRDRGESPCHLIAKTKKKISVSRFKIWKLRPRSVLHLSLEHSSPTSVNISIMSSYNPLYWNVSYSVLYTIDRASNWRCRIVCLRI